MADNNGKGWHGDPQGHAQAGSQSSGNRNAAENLDDEARSKGGKASRGNQNSSEGSNESGRGGNQ